MDTSATNSGRFSRIGSTAPAARSGRRNTAFARGDAVADADSAGDRDDRPPERDDKARQDSPQDTNFAISPETQLVLLTSTDTGTPGQPSPRCRRIQAYGEVDNTPDLAPGLPKAPRFSRTV